jgi:hypothetical protein
MISAISRTGIQPQQVAALVTSPSAAVDMTHLGLEALARDMQNAPSPNDKDFRIAQDAYAAIRAEQRAQYRNAKGRA